MADKAPRFLTNATVIKVLAKVFALQALKMEGFKKSYAKQRAFYEDRLTGAFALEHISQSERETRLLELWLKQSEESSKDES
jgi:hypothetical protein